MPLPQRAKNLLTPARRAQARRWLGLLTVRGMGGVAGVGATVVATRVLGADEAGLLLLAFAIVTVLATLSRLGLDNALVRFIGAHAAEGDWHAVNGVFRLAIRWTLMTSLPAGLLLLVLADPIARHAFDKPDLAPVLQWISLLTAPMALYWLHAQGFIGLKRPEVATLLQNISLPLLFAALLLLAAWQGIASATAGAGAWLVAGCLTLLIATLIWWRQPDADWKDGAFDRARLWHSAAPLWAVSAMGLAVQWSGQLAAGA